MKILIDMNLTPEWEHVLKGAGIEAVHWSVIGRQDATDREIMDYALQNEYVVFTHDLDFGDILASTGAKGPSVIQVRTDNTSPEAMQELLLKAITQFSDSLNQGALITLVPDKMRARVLPLIAK